MAKEIAPPRSEIAIPKRLTFLKQVYDILKPLSKGEKRRVHIESAVKRNTGEGEYAILVISPIDPKYDIPSLNEFVDTITNEFSFPKPFDENSPFFFEQARAYDENGGFTYPKIVFDAEAIAIKGKKPIMRESTTVIICPSPQTAKQLFRDLENQRYRIPRELKPSKELAYGITEKQLALQRKVIPKLLT